MTNVHKLNMSRYPSQSFEIFEHPQWRVETKAAHSEDGDSSILDAQVLDRHMPAELTPLSDLRNIGFIKSEEDYSSADNMWSDRPQPLAHGVHRQYSQPIVPTINTQQPFMQSYATPYHQSQCWPMSTGSGTSTPTPLYSQVSQSYGPSPTMAYPLGGPVLFAQPTQNLHSAVSMSPQSSQGGWGSTSSDTTEPHDRNVRSPSYGAVSPTSAVRPDGVRKKNARFDIPKERNLHNIDSLIMCSRDEQEKKELKQQKRLLRNRQAALDSRQRKKSHTEKLEQEKMFSQQKQDMEDAIQTARDALQAERDLWMQERQQYDQYIRGLELERDEAIRTKTLETADLRRKISFLKDHVKDLERQLAVREYSTTNAASHDFSNDYTSFGNLDIDDAWEDEFGFNDMSQHEDLKMDSMDVIQQQLTPKPHPVSFTSSLPKSSDNKSDVSFWNAFYMCLLFGAFVATNSTSSVRGVNSNTASASSSSSSVNIPPTASTTITIPSLSEDYRAEAGNVLKAVLNSNPESLSAANPLRSFHAAAHHANSNAASSTHLETLHNTLTSPTPEQAVASAFSLSADSYNHITNPDFLMDHDNTHADIDEAAFEHKLTPLQARYKARREEREASGIDRILSGGEQRGGASLLWDRVPAKVLRDFHEMVRSVEGVNVDV